MLTSRILPPSEWAKLANTSQFGEVWPLLNPNPQQTQVIAVEDDRRQIVGTWGLFSYFHVEGLWRHPDAGAVAINRRLWLAMRQQVQARGARSVITSAADGDVAIRQLIETAGGTALPASFVLPLFK